MSVKSKKCGGGPRSPRRDRDATPRQTALSSSLFPSLLLFLLSFALSVSSVGIPLPPFAFDKYVFFRVSVVREENFYFDVKNALETLTLRLHGGGVSGEDLNEAKSYVF